MKQLSFIEDMETTSPITLLECLSEYIDVNELIPYSLHRSFYTRIGRNRKYSLKSFICALLLQKILTIPTDSLLITILKLSKEVREFCGFYKGVPDKTQFSRFRTTFADEIENLFHHLVDITEPICKQLGKRNSEILIVDTTGIEAYVAENNAKYLKGALTKLNTLIKSKDVDITNIDSSLLAYMNKHSSANPDIKLQYINSHYAYAHKGTIVCNAHGIIRHMQLDGFNCDIADLEHSKHVHDSTLLIPTLQNLYNRHPDITGKYLCGDSGFDSTYNHNTIFKNFKLITVIDLNQRKTNDDIPSPSYPNEDTPCCPRDDTLPLRYVGICKEAGRATRFKYICPKVKSSSSGYITHCDTPCSSAKCGYIHYEYESDNLRANPPLARDCDKYISVSSKRYIVEQVISRLKLYLNMGGSYLRHSKTCKADFFMAGIAHLVTVLLAYRMNMPLKVRSTKSIA